MLLREIVETSARVAGTGSRTAKVAALADTLARADGDDLAIAAHYLSGSLRQRRTGVGWRSLAVRPEPASEASLTLAGVDATFAELGALAGAGSQGARQELLAGLLGRATAAEQAFLAGLVTGETRQGALEGLLLPAIAQAFSVPLEGCGGRRCSPAPSLSSWPRRRAARTPSRRSPSTSDAPCCPCSPPAPARCPRRWTASVPASRSRWRRSWTASASRSTATARTSGCTRAASTTSPRSCPGWSRSSARCRPAGWCWTARRSRCVPTDARCSSRTPRPPARS